AKPLGPARGIDRLAVRAEGQPLHAHNSAEERADSGLRLERAELLSSLPVIPTHDAFVIPHVEYAAVGAEGEPFRSSPHGAPALRGNDVKLIQQLPSTHLEDQNLCLVSQLTGHEMADRLTYDGRVILHMLV